jgi:hypothetical protein
MIGVVSILAFIENRMTKVPKKWKSCDRHCQKENRNCDFGFLNTPNTFQRFGNEILMEVTSICCVNIFIIEELNMWK